MKKKSSTSTTPIGTFRTVEDARRDGVSQVAWYKGGVEVAMWRKNSGTLLFNIRASAVLAEKDLRNK